MNVVRARASPAWWLSRAPLFIAAAVLMAALVSAGPSDLGGDFKGSYLAGAELLRETGSPYGDLDDYMAGDRALGYVYPPHLALALLPLTWVPLEVSILLAFFAAVAALFASLAIVGVRDVRCYAAVVLWTPAWFALEMANASALLALLAALSWRYRTRLWPLAGSLGAMVSLKLFLWPMLVWAAATGRYRAGGLAIVLGGATAIGSWAVIGFSGFSSYPERLELVAAQDSYSLAGLAESVGLGDRTGMIVTWIVGGAILACCVGLARRGHEAHAFLAGLIAALALSPIVWLHYLVILVAPLGVLRPRFSAVWLVPIVLWVCPRDGNGDGVETFLPGLVVAVLAVLLLAPWRSRGMAPREVTA
jgi:hypothetical protein